MCVGIKEDFIRFCHPIHTDVNNLLCFRLERNILNTVCDVIFVCMYIPPEGSSYYRNQQSTCALDEIDTFLTDHITDIADCHVLLCGDLNSRCADNNNYSEYDPDSINNRGDPFPDESVHINDRHSRDSVINRFGRTLLNICNIFNLCIVNGRVRGDTHGEFTFIGNQGSSVNDYFICSTDFLSYISSLYVGDRTDSDHFPLDLSFVSSSLLNRYDECNEQVNMYGMTSLRLSFSKTLTAVLIWKICYIV